jgi:hypothetical protein
MIVVIGAWSYVRQPLHVEVLCTTERNPCLRPRQQFYDGQPMNQTYNSVHCPGTGAG